MVGEAEHALLALGVREHERVRMLRLQPQDLALGEGDVHRAGPGPQQHVAAGSLDQVPAQLLVGREEDRPVRRARSR